MQRFCRVSSFSHVPVCANFALEGREYSSLWSFHGIWYRNTEKRKLKKLRNRHGRLERVGEHSENSRCSRAVAQLFKIFDQQLEVFLDTNWYRWEPVAANGNEPPWNFFIYLFSPRPTHNETVANAQGSTSCRLAVSGRNMLLWHRRDSSRK